MTARTSYAAAAGASAYLLLLYTMVFTLTGQDGPAGAFVASLHNVLPLAVLGWLTVQVTMQWTVARPLAVQVAVHLAAPLVFGVAWYLGIQILRGMTPQVLTEGLRPAAFVPIVLAWQIVQGAFAYAAVAAAGYWAHERRLRLAKSDEAAPAAQPERLLLREDGQIRTIAFSSIVAIRRTGDYSEVLTRTGKHLTTRSLTDLASSLPSSSFVRAHRSALINLEAVTGAEPAGNGRLSVFMEGGEVIEASRAGRKAILERTA